MLPRQSKHIAYKSLFAGIIIGIGACGYSHCSNHYIGAALFSFGLLVILNMDGLLYTGKIGYFEIKDSNIKEQILKYIYMLLINIIGVLIVGLLTIDLNNTIFMEKLNHHLLYTFVSSILCGVIMYLAVELWKRNANPLYVIMAIMIFILCEFDHCIANVYYFAINPVPACQIKTIIFFIINIIGNTLGSLGIRYISNAKII